MTTKLDHVSNKQPNVSELLPPSHISNVYESMCAVYTFMELLKSFLFFFIFDFSVDQKPDFQNYFIG